MSKPITIKQACERVETLRSNIEHCDNLRYMIRRDADELKNGIGVRVYNDRYAAISVQNILEILAVQQMADKAEIERLQPVIDMANAALKGVLS